MKRYIVQKAIYGEYCGGHETLMEDGRVKKFYTEEQALQWLMANDYDFIHLPLVLVCMLYEILPYYE